jgi:hypothetical protein
METGTRVTVKGWNLPWRRPRGVIEKIIQWDELAIVRWDDDSDTTTEVLDDLREIRA